MEVNLDGWVKFAREIGFPAAVAAFVLWRLEAAMREVVRELINVRLTMAAIVGQNEKAAALAGIVAPAVSQLFSQPWDGRERRRTPTEPSSGPLRGPQRAERPEC
jgi:hypothetical protein